MIFVCACRLIVVGMIEQPIGSGYDDVSKDVSNNIVTSPIVESERTTSTDKMKNKNNEQPSLRYKLETKIRTV